MEPSRVPPSGSDKTEPPASLSRDGKLQRISDHTQGLVSDLQEWIDLRLDLALIEVEERVDELRNDLALGVTVAILGFFAAFFVLTTVALGLGWLLGHPFWGFLIVGGVLTLVIVALNSARPALMPSSDLYRRIRGTEEPSVDGTDRPSRRASASVEEDSAADDTSRAEPA